PHRHAQLQPGRPQQVLQEFSQRLFGGRAVEPAALHEVVHHRGRDAFLCLFANPGVEPGARILLELPAGIHDFLALTGAFVGWARFRYHCWPMPTRLLVRMYTARPLEIGKSTNIRAKEMGMNFIIICCCGSVVVMGVILETRYMEAPITTG